MRIEDDNLSAELVADEIKWRDEICVAADQDKCLGGRSVSILEKFCHEIYVGPLLLHLHDMYITINCIATLAAFNLHGRNPCLVLVVVALDDFHSTMCLYGTEVDVLSLYCCGIMRIGLYSGGKIFDIDKIVAF